MKTFRHKPNETQLEELRPRNAQRADIIPTEGFAMVVDGKLKGNFADEQTAKAAGEELLENFRCSAWKYIMRKRGSVLESMPQVNGISSSSSRFAVSVFGAERIGFTPATSSNRALLRSDSEQPFWDLPQEAVHRSP